MDLRGYSYEPEYTTEELDELSRAAVCPSVRSSVRPVPPILLK